VSGIKPRPTGPPADDDVPAPARRPGARPGAPGRAALRRPGRPRTDQAGEVEQRVLDAASQLFLSQGFGRTSFDQVAQEARASKTTLYTRYPTKTDLFEAVVRRQTAALLTHFEDSPSGGEDVEARLVVLGAQLADLTLTEDSIALMRVTAAEAETMPDAARTGFQIGFGACVRYIADGLAADTVLDSDSASKEVSLLATRFVELALHPLYMHAFFGADLADLRARSAADVVEVAHYLTHNE